MAKKRPPPGKHKIKCPFCGLVVFIEFTATESHGHHQTPICAQYAAIWRVADAEATVTPAKDVYEKFGN